MLRLLSILVLASALLGGCAGLPSALPGSSPPSLSVEEFEQYITDAERSVNRVVQPAPRVVETDAASQPRSPAIAEALVGFAKDAWQPYLNAQAPPLFAQADRNHYSLGSGCSPFSAWTGGGWYSGPACIPPSTFDLGLQTSLVPDYSAGSGTASFSRASTAYQEDFEAKRNLLPSGAARMQGARVVYNLITTDTSTLAIAANKTVTVGVGTFIFSMGAEATASSVITFTGTATGSTGTLTANAANRTARTLTITAGGTIIMTASVAAANDLQLEDVTGQSNQNPSEYVSVGVLSAPYHGLNVDGLKAFAALNGNTVASNVVTEATGAAINNSNAKFAVLSSGSSITTPDSVAASITGDIDARAQASSYDFTAGTQTLIAKRAGTAEEYQFRITAGGTLQFIIWQAANARVAESTAAIGFSANTAHHVRATRASASGNVNFYTSENGTSWTLLGNADIITTAGAINDSDGVLSVGSYSIGTEQFLGRIYRAQIYNGINGTLAVDFNPNLHSSGATWTAATGEVWTINGVAKVFGSNSDATYGIPAQWDAGGPFGYLSEGARADVLGITAAIRRTMTDVGWVNGGTVTVGAATGVDGVASAAASLTGGAVAATNTILYTTVLGAAVRTYSAWVRRTTGTGVVSITGDGGVTWTPMTLTTAYKQFSFVTASAANPVVGFKINTNLDAIEVDFNTLEAAAFANPTPIPVNVSKAADVLTYPSAGNISGTVGTAYAEFTIAGTGANASAVIGLSNNSVQAMYVKTTAELSIFDLDTETFSSTYSSYTALNKGATSWGGTVKSVSLSGVAAISGTFDGDLNVPASFVVGSSLDGATNPLFGTIRQVRIYPTALSSGRLQAMTTP